MARKWFQLVGEDGKDLTSATSVAVDVEDVDTLRDAVFVKVSRVLPATVIASDLTVFENRAKYDAKEALEEDSPIGSFGGSKKDALIVQVPQRAVVMDVRVARLDVQRSASDPYKCSISDQVCDAKCHRKP
ncbi:unnamed protein product [Phytophthora lilii]|uniref:Unnamed protein product n=1 Tax=Phytophthora lilii TaxID=2077276 RepID=A0A9W6XTI7_9STRA|nr:unnamed protein product [Phytophthora lilii]